jgi:hypothetical protein
MMKNICCWDFELLIEMMWMRILRAQRESLEEDIMLLNIENQSQSKRKIYPNHVLRVFHRRLEKSFDRISLALSIVRLKSSNK